MFLRTDTEFQWSIGILFFYEMNWEHWVLGWMMNNSSYA